MAPSEKRNQFLDAGDSDDDIGRGYNSEDDFQKGVGGGRSTKRRRVSDDDEDSGSDFSDAENDDLRDGGAKLADEDANSEQEPISTSSPKQKKSKTQSQEDEENDREAKIFPGLTKPLTRKNLIQTEKAIKRSGVVYLSRVPPFMKPAKVRSLLEPYGNINRMFLSPEDPAIHARRVRQGGNKKRSYTEGWIEFVNKSDAKKVCDLLNAQTIGGKKGGYYRDDIWNLVYLKSFKWHNLTEQIAAENAERQARMRAEISKSTKENKEFVRNLERAKVLEGMAAKKELKKKRKKGGDGEDGDGEDGVVGGGTEEGEESKGQRKRAMFKQVPLAKKRKGDDEGTVPEPVQRVGSKIFG